VSVFHIYRRVAILMVFKRAIVRWSSIVCIEVEVGAVRGECRDLGMAGGSDFPR